MIRETRELLVVLSRLNRCLPEVCMGLMAETLTPERQAEFGALLIESGHAIQKHAKDTSLIVDIPDDETPGGG